MKLLTYLLTDYNIIPLTLPMAASLQPILTNTRNFLFASGQISWDIVDQAVVVGLVIQNLYC